MNYSLDEYGLISGWGRYFFSSTQSGTAVGLTHPPQRMAL
jgi:hypothetical protein